MADSNVSGTEEGNSLDFDPSEDVSSTTPPIDEPKIEDEFPSPAEENELDEKEETPAVEDLPTVKTDSDEKPEDSTSTTKGYLVCFRTLKKSSVTRLTNAPKREIRSCAAFVLKIFAFLAGKQRLEPLSFCVMPSSEVKWVTHVQRGLRESGLQSFLSVTELTSWPAIWMKERGVDQRGNL